MLRCTALQDEVRAPGGDLASVPGSDAPDSRAHPIHPTTPSKGGGTPRAPRTPYSVQAFQDCVTRTVLAHTPGFLFLDHQRYTQRNPRHPLIQCRCAPMKRSRPCHRTKARWYFSGGQRNSRVTGIQASPMPVLSRQRRSHLRDANGLHRTPEPRRDSDKGRGHIEVVSLEVVGLAGAEDGQLPCNARPTHTRRRAMA